MAEMAEAAMQYAAAGYRIFPTHGIVNGHCTCNKNGRSQCTPGKHPWIPKSNLKPEAAGGGVTQASADVELVSDWWRMRPRANIALALGQFEDGSGGMFVMDVDNADIAQRVLKLFASDRAPAGFAIATSGRDGGGVHIYFRSAADQHSEKLATTGGEKIGELLGWNSYVVLPPSLHISGRRYTFTHGNLVSGSLGLATDPVRTVTRLLALTGVAVTAPKARVRIGAGEYSEAGQVRAIECPFRISNSYLIQLLSGTMPTGDRSQALLDIGRLLWREAAANEYPITVEEVAGVIRGIDEKCFHKFDGRRDPNRWYWEKALETQRFFQGSE